MLLSSVPLFMVANKNFLPNDDQSEFEIGLRAPEGAEHRRDRADRQPDRDAGCGRCRKSTTRWSRSRDDPAQTPELGHDLRAG